MRERRNGTLPARALFVALWAAALASAVALGLWTMRTASKLDRSAVSYYTAARLVREGRFGARVYEDGWFAARVEEDAPGLPDLFRPNPPPAALLFLPVAGLPFATARLLASIASLLLVAGSVAIVGRRAPLGGRLLPLFVLAAALWHPLRANLWQTQVYALVLFLGTLAWAGLRGRRDAVAGGALGLLVTLKLALLPLWLVTLLRRRFRALAWGAATGGALVAVSLSFSDLKTWRVGLGTSLAAASRPEASVRAYQSQTSLVKRLLAGDPRWNPRPVAEAPGFAAFLAIALALATAASVAWATLRDGRGDAAVSAAVAGSLAVGPLSQDYHYLVALLPLGLLLGEVARRRDGPAGAAVAAAAVLVGMPPLPIGGDPSGWLLLLAYPKLAGAWLLLAAAVRLAGAGAVDRGGSVEGAGALSAG